MERFFTDKLDLTEDQSAQFKTLWETHHKEVRTIKEEIRTLRRERMERLTQANPDPANLLQAVAQKVVVYAEILVMIYVAKGALELSEDRIK